MSNVLQLLDRGRPTLRGWQETDQITAGEAERIREQTSDVPRQTKTAIPTPFGRMHLFETAFKFVRQQPVGNSIYHQMVSQCWDLLELLFFSRDTDAYRLRFVPWDTKDQLDKLLTSPEPRVRLLGNTLGLYLNDPHFRGFDTLYLVFADSHDAASQERRQLLGGTSPFTLVFTHPAVPRLDMQRRGEGNGFYFDQQLVPLSQRAADFQAYIYGLFQVQEELRRADFAQSVFQLLAAADQPRVQRLAEEKLTHEQLTQGYEPLHAWHNRNNVVQVRGVTLWHLAKAAVKETSDWFIRPSRALAAGVRKPLVLMPGLDLRRGDYFGGTPGTDQTVVRWGYPGQALDERRLETLGIQYPFLTVNDFLEDQLVELPFAVDTRQFHFGDIEPEPGARPEERPWRYLLPVKRLWFDYFEPADLDRRLRIVLYDNHAQVQLTVPLENGREVVYERSYYFRPGPSQGADASVAARPSDSPSVPYRGGRISSRLDVGIFPFYRLAPDAYPAGAVAVGPYYVQLTDDNSGPALASLQFYQGQGHTPLPLLAPGSRLGVRPQPRLGRLPGRAASTYYEVRGTPFDFVEVSCPVSDYGLAAVTGVLVPRWTVVGKGAQRYTFAVDFGTTNTHVAYGTAGQPAPQPFRIDTEREMQAVMLNQPRQTTNVALPRRYDVSSFGSMGLAEALRNREFVPAFIGAEGAEVAFPIRTATYEAAGFANVDAAAMMLFGSVNIGFRYNRDGVLPPEEGRYSTNLKWGTEGPDRVDGAKRVRASIRELLLLIKHKAALSDGDLSAVRVVWSRPLSMRPVAVRDFRDIWQEEYQQVFGHAPGELLADLSESWAPYVYLTDPNTKDSIVKIGKENVVNIDVGGGTTDVLLVRGSQPEATLSFRFAGDALWGDGLRGGYAQRNALLAYYKKRTDKQHFGEEAGAAHELFKNAFDSQVGSADVASLLFNFDQQLGFSKELRSARHLRVLLLLHYAAIVYHVGQVCRARGLAVPRYLCFSGKGSTYLRILDLDPQLGTLTQVGRLVLEFATGQPAPPDFALTLVSQPKEATANGAVLWKLGDASADKRNAPPRFVLAGTLPPAEGDAAPSQEVTLAEAEHLDEPVLANARHLVRFLTHDSRALRGLLDELNIEMDADFVASFLDGKLKDSYYAGLEALRREGARADEALPETLFFLPFRDALFQLGQELFNRHYAA